VSAPIDKDTNTFSSYAPKRCRAERAAQTSEVVNALAAVRGGPGGGENCTRRGFLADVSDGEATIQRQNSLARSLDPEFLPPPPSAPRSRWRLSVGLLTAISLMAVAYFSGSERPSPRPIASREQASDHAVNPASPSGSPASELTTKAEPEIPRLQFGTLRGIAAESALSGIRLHGRADGATILFSALAVGTTLSGEFAADAWPVSTTEAVLTSTWDIPPKDSIGAIDLAANRWPFRISWSAASQVIPNSGWGQQPSVAPPHDPARYDREETVLLIKQGRLFLANRDPAGARVVLERAAQYKDAEAALMLAGTYDPVVLRELKIYGVAANIAKARTWYEKAKEFGSTEAPRRLEVLAGATQ
jgi:hypothetical protein